MSSRPQRPPASPRPLPATATRRPLPAAAVRRPLPASVEGRPGLLRTAHVRRPHGIRGEVRVESLGGDVRRFRSGVRVTVESTGRTLTLRSARGLGDGDLLLGFREIETPEAAAPLRGAYLCVAADRARRLPPGEWFVWQLVGMEAVDPEGRPVGVVADVETGTAHDVLVVDAPGGERRFPMVAAFVREVDVEGRRMVLTPWDEEEA